jgi:hypothetical protein
MTYISFATPLWPKNFEKILNYLGGYFDIGLSNSKVAQEGQTKN